MSPEKSSSNINRKKPITFGEIALALASDYDMIFVIDSEDDSYVEYSADGDNKTLKKRAVGKDFYKDVIHDAREQVHPEDQAFFLESFRKENVTDILTSGKSFSLNYRMMVNGEPLYYYLKTIRGGDRKVIIGVRNVDEQRRRELKSDEDIRVYRHIAGALASRYEVIYYINTEDNSYTQYSSSDEYAKLGTTRLGADFFKDAGEDIRKYIHPDDMEHVLYELEKETLLEHLRENGSISLTYRQVLGDSTQYVNMIAVRPKNDKDHIVMAVLNIDAQIKREQSMREEHEVFEEVIKALAARYEVIYRVNVVTNEYSEYNASEEYAKIKVGSKGADFFSDSQTNMKKDIYPEDLPMMQMAMRKETLLNNLQESGRVYLNYRLMLNGHPQYVALIVVRTDTDSDHIIVAVENIDQAKRKELEFEKAIGSAMAMANKDQLTGIKNKHAYANTEMQLDEQISRNPAKVEFAIAVCDVNGLKQVNDLQGHSAGDEYIREACKLICNTFKHSPVFRIGGDEFVVILKGADFENRMELIAEFGLRQVENRKNDLVTLAYGISDFRREVDNRVQDVFERADSLMYENKKRFKGEAPGSSLAQGIAQTVNMVLENDKHMRFYVLYEQLVSAMTDVNDFDVSRIESLLVEICTMFRLAKGITRIYRNRKEEEMGLGESLCCFDSGKECEPIISFRVVTSVMSIATITVYMSPDEEPLTEDEKWKVELTMRTTLSFVSRNRLKCIVEELAYYDDSGYPNLRSLTNYVAKRIQTGKMDNMLAFRYNLRHFSLINKEFGREAGDVIMKKHYEMLKEIAGEDGFIARLGGDNFVGLCSYDKADEVVRFLSDSLLEYGNGNVVSVQTSAGLYKTGRGTGITVPGDILEKIIIAYRVAHEEGNDRIIFFDESIMEKKAKSMLVQKLFPDALSNGEFVPYYQPKVNTITGEIEGAEALCRWFHNGQIVQPGDFIPMLEETSDICRLDLYMFEHVCRDIRRWLDEGRKAIRISVNLSRKNIMNTRLADTIVEIIDHYNVPHELIEIELTETTTDVNFSDLKRIVSEMHSNNIFMSVDDFGIGFSSLNLLKEIPWDAIKIDRSFLPPNEETAPSEDRSENLRRIMFQCVITLAGRIGLDTVAEGVETKEQLQMLQDYNCGIAQGFYFDMPLPVSEFEDRLEGRIYDVG